MNEELLEAYKSEIRRHYLTEQKGHYSQYLLSPTRAKLRQLCIERFKNNPTSDDLSTFRIFFGFDFDEKRINRLKEETDKLRPIENFIKSATDCNSLESLNLAAILIDFKPRPFLKFARVYTGHIERGENNPAEKENKETQTHKANNTQEEAKAHTEEKKKEKKPGKTPIVIMVNQEAKANNIVVNHEIKTNNATKTTSTFFTRQRKIVFASVAGLLFAGYAAKVFFFPGKECMQWQGDHYELVDCQTEQLGIGNVNGIIPYNAVEFKRRKLNVCEDTPFFRNNKPIVWYSKRDNVVEFFNMDGCHPETGAELNQITDYMIDKYVEPCK